MRDFKKMVQDIDALVETDEAASLFDRLETENIFTQEEARKMSSILGRIYHISHGITCSCGDKYEIKP